ncbi:hypothetical protein PHMEG_00033960 [Phytophthora megakarya]|uniref:Uncharacterized protein n=1 Tax=Phytophthora megakarya TaxID=4795 RepID=A0A225USK0_9STRA|nr:hypothetical protein PHMEG_00033960 [Phytophthora megakarya]
MASTAATIQPSEEAQALLGNTQLKICCSLVTIRKYSKNDKLYFVDLRYLPPVPQTRLSTTTLSLSARDQS